MFFTVVTGYVGAVNAFRQRVRNAARIRTQPDRPSSFSSESELAAGQRVTFYIAEGKYVPHALNVRA
jgi:hypothetical protein